MEQRLALLTNTLVKLTLIGSLVAFPGAGLANAPTSSLHSQSQAEGAAQHQQTTPSPLAVQSSLDPYRAEFISQNAYPRLTAGGSYRFEVTVRNAGQAGWRPDTVHLGTDRPRDRIPAFIREGGDPSGWVSPNRVAMARDGLTGLLLGDLNGNDTIDAGEQATFRFWYTVPADLPDGIYTEYFNVVADGITWLNDLGIFWTVTVDNAPHARFVDQNPYPGTLRAGDSYEFRVRFENVGILPWRDGGPTPVHLGTDRLQDRIPGFVREGPAGTDSGWVKENRIRLDRDPTTGRLIGDLNGNDQIDQGEVARFRFWYTVPQTMESGLYQEFFRPVMDNRDHGWMEDYGVFWAIPVDNIAPRPASVTVIPLVNHLRLKWSPVPEATSFKVRIRPVGSEVFSVLDFPSTVTEANIDVVGGQDFEVGVGSVDAQGVSPFTVQIVHVESPEEVAERLAREEAERQVRERLAEQPPTEVTPPPAPEPPIVTGPPAEEPPVTRDWRSFWLTLLILLGAAGLATAGYYGYEWWAEARRPPAPPRRPEPPKREEPPKPPAERW